MRISRLPDIFKAGNNRKKKKAELVFLMLGILECNLIKMVNIGVWGEIYSYQNHVNNGEYTQQSSKWWLLMNEGLISEL